MSSPVLTLTWHLARRSGRRGLQGQLLAAAAAAVSALVLLVLLAAWLGAGARADRTAWRTPRPDRHGTAVQSLATTFVRGEPVTVVNLAQLPGHPATPAPPGVAAFPRPGQVYLSPALARLAHRLPAAQLADRFRTSSSTSPAPARASWYRTIGDAGLAAPDELLAVIGRTDSDPAVSEAADNAPLGVELTARAVVSGYSGTGTSWFTASDRPMVLLGAGLLGVPVLVLAAASGRLGAARREQRLAAMRLAGATPRQILAMTGVEAAAVGATGALAGALIYGALLPALVRLPFGIGTWYAGDLWTGAGGVLAVVGGVALLTGVSAVSALRQVVRSPLGVAQQSDPRRTRVVRLLLFAGLLFYVITNARDNLDTSHQVALLMLFYAAFWIVGPWAVDQLGRLLGRYARRPGTLLAARRLSDDPRGAWRTVSGLVLAGFIAGFFSVAHLDLGDNQHAGQIAVSVPEAEQRPGALREVTDQARERLKKAGVTATVRAWTGAPSDDALQTGDIGFTADVAGEPDRFDTAVTAMTGLDGSDAPFTEKYITATDDMITAELQELSMAALALGFVIATASAGLTTAADVLDRRRVYGLLRLAGTPLKVLDRARVRETVIPLVVLAGGVTASGIYIAMKLNEAGGTTVNTAGALRLAAGVLVGTGTMFAAIGASRPLLRSVTSGAIHQPD